MRLRSARLAAAGENEPPSEPAVTTRQSKRRAKSRKTEILEADQPPSGQLITLATEPAYQTETGREDLHDASDSPAKLLTRLQTAESPVFNAEAAAEAVRMAKALLSSTPPSGQQCLGTTASAASPFQSHHSDIGHAGHELLTSGSGLSAPKQHAACIPAGNSLDNSSAAEAEYTGSLASHQPAPAAYGQHAAEVSPSTTSARPKTEGLGCSERPGEQLAICEGPATAETVHIQCHGGIQSIKAAQPLTTAGSEGSWAGHTEGTVQKSPEQRRVTGRASLALQSRRASRSGSAEAFERGRKSGIWLGSADVKLGTIEQQWDMYKATSQRGWTLPKLEELHAKSKALESSGFTTVHSPKLRASSRSALTQAKPGNQLKRKAAEESAPAGALSKAAKTGTGSDSSPRRKLTVKRSESISRTALTEGGQRTVDNAVDRPSDAAAKGASPGRSAGAGSAAWAPSPSRFRRSAQENRAPAAAFRRGAEGWVK
ncbi:g13038 [Coccomyxa viridis]|uniref:G13038 protein n=1 Tax=Coccomyxa viridis TaxID=1274662 RepID=A0ABP1GBU6_9CHLO